MSKRKIIEVVWDDHSFVGGEHDARGLTLQRSVGYVVRESKKVLTLAQSYQHTEKKYAEVLYLDQRCIRSRKELG